MEIKLNYFYLTLFILFLSSCSPNSGDPTPPPPTPTPIPTPTPTPTPKCSTSDLQKRETQLNDALAAHNIEEDFTFTIEKPSGRNFTYNKGASTINTSYRSASSSKWVASSIILRLVDKNKLALTDKPQEKIPGWPITSADPLFNMTLADLLSFRSGLVSDHLCLNLKISNFETCVRNIVKENALNGKVPGQGFYYGGSHLQAAGLMAIYAGAKVSWKDLFSEFKSETSLFSNSDFDLPGQNNPRLAGGMTFTAKDYLGFLRKFYNGDLLSDPLRTQMISDQIGDPSLKIENSPAAESGRQWHYGFGLWIECPNSNFNCITTKSISSPGAFGSYPFMDFVQKHYGIIALEGPLVGSFTKGADIFDAVKSKIDQWTECP